MGSEYISPQAAQTSDGPSFALITHAYQPGRVCMINLDLAGKPYHTGFSVVPGINQVITHQVYEPILSEVEHLPPGLITSIYAPLRSYLKKNKPELFVHIQEAVRNTPDREYCVLGNPLVHLILPFLPPEDQRMLLEAGKTAFIRDFGFAPKGLWLPETAVSKEVLHNAFLAGYEFVPLRDSQVTNIPPGIDLDARHNVCMVKTGDDEEIALLLGNSGLSGFVSYTPWSTHNAERFMEGRREIEQAHGLNALMMMDLELFGHHQVGADQFLNRALKIQEKYGFSPLNMRQILKTFKQGKEATYVDVIDNSSWSCPHNLGRWTGNCGCDNPSESALRIKKEFYTSLMTMNNSVNSALDNVSFNWRKGFSRLFVRFADDIFIGGNFGPLLFETIQSHGDNEEQAKLYLAKIEIMVGLTSCGWFFGGDDSPERNIPSAMIQGVKDLFPGILAEEKS